MKSEMVRCAGCGKEFEMKGTMTLLLGEVLAGALGVEPYRWCSMRCFEEFKEHEKVGQ